MAYQFCTHCSNPVATGARFCGNCGQPLTDATNTLEQTHPLVSSSPAAAPVAAKEPLAARPTKLSLIGWLDSITKVTGFGAMLVGVLDFVSPYIALLPAAAGVAVAGLLATIALRRYVAPSLPATSALRQALAPESGLHRSRLLLGTGVVSALMVTGAAWSNANAVEGGIIASKFDAVKNAQMQLFTLQAVQKEQRVQTAVLEDIRDGRTLNPRRELANQGILWTDRAFRDALDAKDLAVVTLFIDGGMTWGPKTGLEALYGKQDAISDKLISRPELLVIDRFKTPQCWNYIRVFNQPTKETEKLQDAKQIRARVLREQDKRWLKLICGNAEGQAIALAELQDQMAKYGTLPASECRQRFTHKDSKAMALLSINYSLSSIPFERDKSETATLRQVMEDQTDKTSSSTLIPMTPENNRIFEPLRPKAASPPKPSNEASKETLTPQVLEAINDYCSMVSRRPAAEYNGWTVESMKKIVAVLK